MNSIKKIFDKEIFFFLSILLLPFFYISGSLLLNLSIVLILILGIYFSEINYLKNFFLKHKFFIISFIFFVILNILYSETKYFSASKVVFYTRFIIFPLTYIIVISKLSDLKLKIITKIFLYLIIFVILDSLIQLIFGKDIFGFPYFYPYHRITGPFGDEMIVGFYLLNFGIITAAFLNYFNLIKKNTNIFIFLFLSIVILLTGERSAYLSFLIFLFFLFIFSKNKKIIFTTLLCVSLSFLILINSIDFLNNKYPLKNIIQDSNVMNENSNLSDKNKNKIEDLDLSLTKINSFIPLNKWIGHFQRANEIIEKNLFFGSGFRNYRIICFDYQKKYFDKKNIDKCSTHPHNFHLEIISDNGFIGYLFFLIFIFYFFRTFIKGKHNSNLGITMIFCLILSFVFPFKTTGSIFTTNYAFVFWYLVANYFFLIKKEKNLK